MNELTVEILRNVGALAVALVGGWATVRAARSSARQRRDESDQTHEISLTEKWQAYAAQMEQAAADVRQESRELEQRMNDKMAELAKEMRQVRCELDQERTARSLAERQRDASVEHVTDLRGAWPPSHPMPGPVPAIIAGLMPTGTHHPPPTP